VANPDYFTVAELQALPDCAAFIEAQILPAAAYFTTIVEREIGRAFIPRTITDELDGDNTSSLLLSRVNGTSVTSATVDGATVDPTLLTCRGGRLRYKAVGSTYRKPFLRGVANVTVTYTAGEATCPADIKNGVMWATRDRLLGQSDSAGIDIRKTSMTNELGGTTTYLLPGEKRPTGYPDLDALIASYVRNTATFGFA
jgi:hypothetical protein